MKDVTAIFLTINLFYFSVTSQVYPNSQQNDKLFPNLLDTFRGSNGNDIHPIGIPYRGSCESGVFYRITSTKQLEEQYMDELECIYSVGTVPDKIPIGILKGQILKVANSQILNRVGEGGWLGKFSSKSKCWDDGTEFFFVNNMIMGMYIEFHLPCYLYIGKTVDEFKSIEAISEDKNDHLFCDYTIRWEHLCPYDPSRPESAVNLGILNTPVFGNANYDLMRLVGLTGDGGWILLGRSMFRDIQNMGKEVITMAWWYLTVYDKEAILSFPGTIGPTRHLTYTYPGMIDIVSHFSSIDNLLFSRNKNATLQRFIYNQRLKERGMPPLGAAKEDYEAYPMAGTVNEGDIEDVGRNIEPLGHPETPGPWVLPGRPTNR